MNLQPYFLYAAGCMMILIAAMHVGIPLVWGWYKEIKELTQQSRRSIIDRNSFLVLLLLIIAYMAFTLNDDMRSSLTGRTLLLMMGIYWMARAVWRALGFPAEKMKTFVAVVYFITGILFFLSLIP